MRISIAAALLLTGLLAAGCSRAGQPSADDPVVSGPASSVASSSPAPASSTSQPASPVPSTHSSVVVPSRVPVSSLPTVPVDGPGGCPTSALQVRALRASGAAGHQYAFLQFTNASSRPCSLTGFPGVQLLKAGQPLGQPAVRSAKPVQRVQLAPGASVTAQLVDDSTCNAANSDSVQIIPPNRTDKIVLPLALRGCPLHIDPVIAG